jgi:DNA polymerase epsilon subunit 1
VHVREFGADAAWRDPASSLVLPDVVCPRCAGCEDLDLCRDPRLAAGKWSCGGCGAARDRDALEARLASQLRAAAAAYQVQDLRCARCATVASSHLQRGCDLCGGALAPTQKASDAVARVAVYHSVARFHELPLLEELSAWILTRSGAPPTMAEAEEEDDEAALARSGVPTR